MKLKVLFRMFEVLHNDLKSIYSLIVYYMLCGDDRKDDKYKQHMDDFNSSFNHAKIDIEEEIKKEEKRRVR